MTKIWFKFDDIKIMKNLDFRLGLIDDWEQVKSLYVKSFPSYERQPVSLIKDRIQANVCKLYVLSEAEECVGFALLWQFEENEVIFIEYLAVNPKFRGKGYGKEIMRRIISLTKSLMFKLVLEIENPTMGTNKNQREKRYVFYKELGLTEVNGINYQLPPISSKKSTPMYLMVYPANYKFEKELLIRIVQELYESVYNRKNNDVFLKEIISSIHNE